MCVPMQQQLGRLGRLFHKNMNFCKLHDTHHIRFESHDKTCPKIEKNWFRNMNEKMQNHSPGGILYKRGS